MPDGIYNADGSLRGSPSDGTGYYNRDGGINVSVPGATIDPTTVAKKSDLPAAASSIPPAAALSGSIGTTTGVYALSDHTHEVKVQRSIVTTNSSGIATWTFAKPFQQNPVMSWMLEDVLSPCIVQIQSISTTSVTVKLLRSQMLPSTLVALNNLISYNIFGATNNLSGIVVHLFAAERTQ